MTWNEFFQLIKFLTKMIITKLDNKPIKSKYKKGKFGNLLAQLEDFRMFSDYFQFDFVQ